MVKSKEKMMDQLYKVYNDQCPNEKIREWLYDPVKAQAHIILENDIEIIHFTNDQKQYFIKFFFSRNDTEYFLNDYTNAIKYSNMPIEQF